MKTPKSWRPMFLVDGKWYGNGQRFATEAAALSSAAARFAVWTVPTDYRAEPSNDEPNQESEK